MTESGPPRSSHAGGLDLQGVQLGDYRLLRRIGRGGMGVVYEAEEIALGRRVALKVLPLLDLVDDTAMERFLREARSAARLHHTSIVPVFRVGEHDGVWFYVMQLIEGAPLSRLVAEVRALRAGGDAPAGMSPERRPEEEAQDGTADHAAERTRELALRLLSGFAEPAPDESSRLEAGSIPPYHRSVARIGLQVADALAYAHAQGVLHRDIKPSNLLVDLKGTVWVADFGLARSGAADSALTLTGEVVGTVKYMAPERLRGISDAQGDIYSLGLTLYELSTLRAPFGETDPRLLLRQVAEEAPCRPRRVDASIPRDLETIVLKAAAKEAGRRYRTAGDLKEDLGRFLRGEPIRARGVSPLERAWLWARRRPLVATLTAAVFLLLAVLAVGSTYFSFNLRERLYQAELRRARAARLSGQPGRRFEGLEAVARAARIHRGPELRDEAVACLGLADAREVAELDGRRLGGRETPRWFGPELEDYATPGPGGRGVVLRRARDEAEVARLEDPEGGSCELCLFSPDGRSLAELFKDGSRLRARIWSVERRQVVLRPPEPLHQPACAFSHDGRSFALLEERGKGALYRLGAPEEGKREFSADPGMGLLRFSPTGSSLALAARSRDQVTLVDLSRGTVARRLGNKSAVWDVAFSPDGRLLATAGHDGSVRIWDHHGGRLLKTLAGHQDAAMSVRFSPAGDLLASSAWDGNVRLWNPWTGDPVVTLGGAFYLLGFYRGGRRLAAVIEERVTVWEVDPGEECRTLGTPRKLPGTVPPGLSFHPQGRFLAFSLPEWAGVWEVASGAEASIPYTGDIRFTPDGRGLVAFSPSGARLMEITVSAGGDSPALEIGPPRLLRPEHLAGASFTADGRRLAAVIGGRPRALLLELARPDGGVEFEVPAGTNVTALSPEGKWLAIGFHKSGGLEVRDGTTGALSRRLAAGVSAHPFFSPGGERLATTAEHLFCLWDTRTWEPIQRNEDFVISRAAFSPDGRLLAVARIGAPVEFLDPASGGHLGYLDPGVSKTVHRIGFGPDASSLAISFVGDGSVQLWDLRAIRSHLQTFGLDYDLPPLPPAPGGGSQPPLRIRVAAPAPEGEAGEPAAASGRHWVEELAQAEAALAAAPRSAHQLNNLAWLLVTAPQERRDPSRALELARAALEIEPGDPALQNTLGVALYRLGRYQEAVDALLASRRAPGSPLSAFDAFFLAMSLEMLGQRSQARDCYLRALEWMDEARLPSAPLSELRWFRAEAEAVLGMEDPERR